MKLNAFAPFFNLKQPGLNLLWSSGVPHFFNRVRTHIDLNNYYVVRAKSAKHGLIILGQTPQCSFAKDIIDNIGSNGLIVSCNESMEYSTVSPSCDVVPSFSWRYYNIEHHHLPFDALTQDTQIHLLVQALDRMHSVYHDGGGIYVHGTGMQGRGALLVGLFLCISDKKIRKKLCCAHNNKDIQGIFLETMARLENMCPQIQLNANKIDLCVHILKQYSLFWQKAISENKPFIPFADVNLQENVNQTLTKSDCLNFIAQSNEYKFFCYQGYKNERIFPVVKKFSESIYHEVLKQDKAVFDMSFIMDSMTDKLSEKEQDIIHELHVLFTLSEQFIDVVNKHSPSIKRMGFDFFNHLLNSDKSFSDKERILKKMIDYVKAPKSNALNAFLNELHEIAGQKSLPMKILGISMLILGTAMTLAAIAGALLTSGGVCAIIMATMGGMFLSAIQIGIGKFAYDLGVGEPLTQSATQLLGDVSTGLSM